MICRCDICRAIFDSDNEDECICDVCMDEINEVYDSLGLEDE